MTRIYLTGTILLSALLGYLTFTRGHDWGDDFAEYLLQAQVVAEGQASGFIDVNRFTIDNSPELIGPYAYPWGFPVCLAPLVHVVQLDLVALKCINLVFFSLTLLCMHALFARRLGPTGSCLLAAMFAFNPNVLGILDYLLSDIPFTFFALLTLVLVDRFVVHREYVVNAWLSHVLLGASAFYATFIRPNGILLLAVVLLCQVVQFRSSRQEGRRFLCRQALAGMIPYAVFVLLKMGTDAVLPDGSANHLSGFRFSWSNTAANTIFYCGQFALLFGAPVGRELVFALCLPFLVLGVRARWRQDYHFLTFCGLNMLLYINWPGRNGMRYVLPMMPFFLYFVFQGVVVAWNKIVLVRGGEGKPILLGPLACVLGVMIAIGLLLESTYLAGSNLWEGRRIEGPFDGASSQLFAFLRQHTATDDRLMFFKPRALRLLTGRAGFASNRPEDIAKADYVVIHKKFDVCNQIKLPAKLPPPYTLKPIFENETFMVFQVCTAKSTRKEPPGISSRSSRLSR